MSFLPGCTSAVAVDAEVVDRHSPKECCHVVSVEELQRQTRKERVVDRVEQISRKESEQR